MNLDFYRSSGSFEGYLNHQLPKQKKEKGQSGGDEMFHVHHHLGESPTGDDWGSCNWRSKNSAPDFIFMLISIIFCICSGGMFFIMLLMASILDVDFDGWLVGGWLKMGYRALRWRVGGIILRSTWMFFFTQ